ncbi:MAG: SGNH/GDSL hydrolase family protein [Proteobacteria bacterium]|nr:SGNH/GDSL hydrolase family protein [Pseudomonadota bacterium]
MQLGHAVIGFVVAALVGAAAVPVRAQTAANGEMPEACRVPRTVFVDDSKLVAAAKRLTKDRRLTIVALGSSSTLGASASTPAATWPARLESDLRRRLPGVEIAVHNRGRARDDSEHMLQRLEPDVLAQKPDLVIWETGTAEAVRQMEVEGFSIHLQAGIEKIAKAGADVLLVTPQYSREMARLIAYQPYIDAMNSIGMRRDVLLFPRFEVMRHWVESGQMQLDNLTPAQTAVMADRLYDCIGRQLARVIVRAVAAETTR